MAFKSPEGFLLGLVLLGTGVALLWLSHRAGQRRLGRFLDPHLLPRTRPLPLPYLLGLLLLLLAAGRPEASLPWRENLTQVMLVVDTSHSMAADDEPPSRLERAKALAKAFLTGLDPSAKVGLVGFGPHGALLFPPSTDREGLLEVLEALRPQGNTALAQGLAVARRALRPEGPAGRDLPEARPPAALLVLSDGAANVGGDPVEEGRALARAGLPVFVRPLGDPRGTVSRIGEGLFFVPADPLGLLRLAQATGGGVLEEDFRPLYRVLKPHRAWRRQPRDLSQALVAAGFLLFAFGAYRSLAQEGRWP
ncbi:vWA domain-containing protein [Thermus thermamylovorans]|uniref:VWA domain-containing protein n=1 Tax=Thermus thermamylovorans TaxID=2509362 RepID=A0A4Q9B311_9DEIN|nr:VWA domain-containing protein [Thermus thermamylovorans]TBH20042.1 VWA domain-containing protein [Thermus thermamylovorans]